MAGSIGSAQAGVWQNFKDSCNGLYVACAKSINNNASTLSTKACNAYAYCIDSTSKNANALATSVSTTAGNVRESVTNTASNVRESVVTAAGDLKDKTIKVTTPVIKPVVSATKSIANGIANTAVFSYEHPFIVGSGALAATALYLSYCRNHAFNAGSSIGKAQAITEYMDDADATPQGLLAYWRYYETQNKAAWKNSADILANWEEVYDSFKLEKANGHSEGDICFINRMTKELDAAKKPLNSSLKELKNALAEYHLAPSTESHQDRCKNNYVNQVIARHMANHAGYHGPARRFLDLSRYEIEAIDREISHKVSRSFINPVKMARRFALPDEAAAIAQYWKVYQLIQRLEALQECLDNKHAELNGGLQAK